MIPTWILRFLVGAAATSIQPALLPRRPPTPPARDRLGKSSARSPHASAKGTTAQVRKSQTIRRTIASHFPPEQAKS